MDGDINVGPVIQSCAFQMFVVYGKPQRFNQVQRGSGRGAKPGYIASIRWYFRFIKDYSHGWQNTREVPKRPP
jgi:hypothetical protein